MTTSPASSFDKLRMRLPLMVSLSNHEVALTLND
jgi:hypothetical protein